MFILTRKEDLLVKTASKILWVEWAKDGKFKKSHKKPKIGYSLLMEPRLSYTWLTTPITEIISQDDNKIVFKTENSTYELIKEK